LNTLSLVTPKLYHPQVIVVNMKTAVFKEGEAGAKVADFWRRRGMSGVK
jgi:hypothetical protein